MINPCWKEVARVKVTAQPEGLWNMVVPYVTGSSLLKITVVPKDNQNNDVPIKWNTTATGECGGNGCLRPPKAPASFLVPSAPFGALIAKIGGSTADLPEASSSGGSYPGRKAFVVGSCTVVLLAATDCGPLFLTMNDSPIGFADHAGELWALIEEAPQPPAP